MKKIIIFVTLVLLLSACGSGESDERALEDIIQAYESAGVELEKKDTPVFAMIDARDGIMFYMDGNKVAIYEYESLEALNSAKTKFKDIMDTDVVNGKFLLETNNEQAKEIFDSIN